ncbi:MAG: glycine hydroxymethyltransferase, partial [Chlamydiia bacterium]|nr:glycine hydroxymethyltransferase [Chlamydiia bacterium]
NHIVMLDVTGYGLTGRQAENALREGHLTVNRNSIPQDPNGAWYTSGIRLGTPAITTLGMKEEQMDLIADAINQLLKHTTAATGSQAKYTLDKDVKETVAKEMQALLSTFPLYPEIPIV